MAGAVLVNRAKDLLQKAPVDLPCELRQRMIHVDDLVEPRAEQIVPPAVHTRHRLHGIISARLHSRRESRLQTDGNLQENTAHPREILQMKINDTAEKSNRFNAKGIVHGRLVRASRLANGTPYGNRLVCHCRHAGIQTWPPMRSCTLDSWVRGNDIFTARAAR